MTDTVTISRECVGRALHLMTLFPLTEQEQCAVDEIRVALALPPPPSGLRETPMNDRPHAWLIYFDDRDLMSPEIFVGTGAEEAAHKRFARLRDNWTCTLFQSVGNPSPSGLRGALAVALLRHVCQLFDSGGESMRSTRAQMAETAFQLLTKGRLDDFRGAFAECDAAPYDYLVKAKQYLLTS